MNPRLPNKRNVCRYFASSGSCFYGDACVFQHVLDPAPAPLASGPPQRSQSAGNPGPVVLRKPGGVVGAGRNGSLPPRPPELIKHQQQRPPFQPRPAPQRPSSYRSSLSHHASNPPKHRMGVAVSKATNTSHAPLSNSKPPGSGRKGDKVVLRGAAEGVNIGGSRDVRGITTLQPPPSSKLAKARGTSSPVAPQSLVQAGGTTYFYSGRQPSYAPDHTAYTKPPSHLARKSQPPGFFVPEELRQELYQQQMACLALPVSEDTCPKEVDSYHSLCPLEPVDDTSPDQESARTFSHASTCYRATNQKDGLYYCLRRIHGFRLTSAKAVQELDKWRQLEHVNIVSLIKMFTTKAFGDHSVVLVYDYHPAARTMKETHLKHSKRTSTLPEDLVWDYIVQLASALRLIHGNHLALRCLEPSKVLLTSSHRLRINCAGIVDIMTFDPLATPHSPSMHQQGDLFCLGQLLLCVGLQSADAGRPEQFHRSMEVIANTYSPELNHLLQYLLHSGAESSPHSILEVMSMSAAHIHSSVERALHREDVLKAELSKEIQNGRLFRVLAKLGVINERPEFAGDEQWSETGDRYLLKLFRDHLFHQVLPSGAPWVNLAHIVQTLNKIDAGTPENIALHSRDEKSVLVVSYSDLKTCLEKTFSEVLSSSGDTRTSEPHADRGQGSNLHVTNGHPVGMFNYGSSS